MDPSNKPRYLCLDPEVMIPISRSGTQVVKTGVWSNRRPVFLEKTSPCRAACPNGNDIPRALKQASDGQLDEALAVFLQESPLPGVCGRVCYHPCQAPCNRGQLDETITIRELERAVSDLGTAAPSMLTHAGTDKPVAVVGSGPAGLSAAYHLARMGHPVTIFEAGGRPGGLLAWGIPEYRLSRAALDRDMNRIFSLPITLKTGREISAEQVARLSADFEAVFLAVGAKGRLKLGIQGEDLDGVIGGLEFLIREDLQHRCRGARVVVIGGGNSAMDAARTAVRRGASSVTIIYRRSRDLMPAFPEEVEQAMEEGIRFQLGAAPIALTGAESRIESVRWVETRPAPPDSRPVPVAGSEKTVSCDLVIVAIGQAVEETSFPRGLRIEKGRVWVDGAGLTSQPNLFAGGDLTPARASVVDAMASGKLAAFFMHGLVLGRKTETLLSGAVLGDGPSFSIQGCFHPTENRALGSVVHTDELDLLGIDLKPAAPKRLRAVDERIKDFREAHASMTPEEARHEAERCFYCGTCIRCDRCFLYCPECSMLRPEPDRAEYRGNSDYCKGCGICASECLRGVLEMGEEP